MKSPGYEATICILPKTTSWPKHARGKTAVVKRPMPPPPAVPDKRHRGRASASPSYDGTQMTGSVRRGGCRGIAALTPGVRRRPLLRIEKQSVQARHGTGDACGPGVASLRWRCVGDRPFAPRGHQGQGGRPPLWKMLGRNHRGRVENLRVPDRAPWDEPKNQAQRAGADPGARRASRR